MAVYNGPGAGSISSEMSPETNGVGMGRRVGPGARTLSDFLPSQLCDWTRKEEKEKKEKEKETSTGPVWTSLIRDPLSPAVILGSWSNSYPYFGLVTRFRSFHDLADPVVRDLKLGGCNRLLCLNEETFAASFYSGSIVLWDYDLTDDSKVTSSRHKEDSKVTSSRHKEDSKVASSRHKEDSKVTFFRHHGEVTGLEASHDRKYLLSCGKDRKVSLMDVTEGVLKDEIREGHFDGVNDLSPAPEDSNCLLTCGQDGAVSLWDWRVKESRREVCGTEVRVTPTAIHWSCVDPNLFYLGTCTGSIASFDIRNISMDYMARDISPSHPVRQIRQMDRDISLIHSVRQMDRNFSPVRQTDRDISPVRQTDRNFSPVRQMDRDRVLVLTQTNSFTILKEPSLISTFSSPPSQGTVLDVLQVDESTLYSVSSLPGFTRHDLVNSNCQTQTDGDSEDGDSE